MFEKYLGRTLEDLLNAFDGFRYNYHFKINCVIIDKSGKRYKCNDWKEFDDMMQAFEWETTKITKLTLVSVKEKKYIEGELWLDAVKEV